MPGCLSMVIDGRAGGQSSVTLSDSDTLIPTHWWLIQPRAWAEPASVTLGELCKVTGGLFRVELHRVHVVASR